MKNKQLLKRDLTNNQRQLDCYIYNNKNDHSSIIMGAEYYLLLMVIALTTKYFLGI